ncbi:MAG TPA: biotin--[acetyl-CoA-carboxylase] ligase [Planctomycetes bacterium]|nr:biotin--[acetyl-CoA-carboxylase] ligase [Planctomycetota bacterium]
MATALQMCSREWYPVVAFLAHCGAEGAPAGAVRDRFGSLPPPGAYALAGAGFTIEEASGGRLRLAGAPPPLAAGAVRALLSREIDSVDVRVFPVLDSTNEYVLSAGGAAAASNVELIVAAETQTRGRGRWGRAWASPPFMGLWFSWWCRARALPPQIVAAAAGVGVLRAMRGAGAADARLRWPNDICIGGGKAGGILVECGPGGCAVGVGLNVRGDAAEYVDADRAPCRPVSIAQAAGMAPERDALLARACAEIVRAARAVARGDGAAVLDAWRDAQDLRGKRVCLRIKDRVRAGCVREVDPARGIRLDEHAEWFMPHAVVRVEEGCER